MIPPTYIYKALHQQRLLDAGPDADAPALFDVRPPRGWVRLARALPDLARTVLTSARPTRA